MSEVSCRATRLVLEALESAGVPVEGLADGLPVSLDELRDRHRHISWDTHAALLDRVAGAYDQLEEIGARVVRLRTFELPQRMAAHVVSALHLLNLAARWTGPALFPVVRYHTWAERDGRYAQLIELPAHLRGSVPFFRITAGVAAHLPTLLGHDPAVCEAEYTPHRARLSLVLPPPLAAARRIERVVRWLRGRQSADEVIAEQRAALRENYDALVRSRHEFHEVLERIPDAVAIYNPLAYVYASLEIAARESARLRTVCDDAPLRALAGALGTALEGVERVRAIVGDLKTLSRPAEEPPGAVDVHPVLEAALELASNEIRHRARLVRDYGDVPAVQGQRARLGQLFLNLVLNAAQAIPEGDAARHRIALRTRAAGNRVLVEVSDTGAGIAPEHLGRIFDPFFTTRPVATGTGLGLSVCHAIVSGLGGEIAVESVPGSGTVFRVTLLEAPRAAADSAARSTRKAVGALMQAKDGAGTVVTADPAETKPAEDAAGAAQPATAVEGSDGAGAEPPAARRARLLIVDDEVALVRALETVLGEAYEVVAVTSGRRALELLLGASSFDLVLCDLMMPDLTGMDLFEQLRDRRPGFERRIVFVTGGVFTARGDAFLASVPNRCLEKPIAVDELLRMIGEALGGVGRAA